MAKTPPRSPPSSMASTAKCGVERSSPKSAMSSDAIWTLNKSAMPFVPKHSEHAYDVHGALRGDASSFYDHTFSSLYEEAEAEAETETAAENDEHAPGDDAQTEISPSSFVRDMASVFAAESTETKSDEKSRGAEEATNSNQSYYVPDGILSSPSPPASVFEVDLQSLGYNLSGARAWFADADADEEEAGKGGAGAGAGVGGGGGFSQLY